jgi:uncharacterized protein (TIGR03118 family)
MRPLYASSSRFALITIALAAVLCISGTAFAQRYLQTNLVSDIPGMAVVTDPNLVNPWGISFSPTGPFWVSDNGTGVSTLYLSDGTPISLIVTVPPPTGGTPPSAPTGQVFNGTKDFMISGNGASGPAFFIFATEDGTISGWNPSVDPTNAVLVVDNSALEAVYKGLASAQTSKGSFLYAANFRGGVVEQYDTNFQLVKTFTDTEVPPRYAPFGIRNINNKLYVTFAEQDEDKKDDVPGPGHGFVDIFDTNGNKLQRLISRGQLNSPWGLALAPSNFGKFSGDLLVGNFGNGHINAYDSKTGKALGALLDSKGNVLSIDGLWALTFGNGGSAGKTNELFFSAGINGEADGLFGKLNTQ